MIYFLEKIINDDECSLLVKEFYEQKKIKTNRDSEDGVNPKSTYGFRGYGVFDVFLQRLKPIIEKYNNKKIRNVNSYVREYKNGSYLNKHVDREDIGITLSICIYSDIKNEWPLCANYENKTICQNLKTGDALLIINSNKIEHWRDRLICNDDETIIQLFLHWTDINEPKSII